MIRESESLFPQQPEELDNAHMEIELKYAVTPERRAAVLAALLELGFHALEPDEIGIEDHYLRYQVLRRNGKTTGKAKSSYDFDRVRYIESPKGKVFYEATSKATVDVGDNDFSRKEVTRGIAQDQFNKDVNAASSSHPVIKKLRRSYVGVIDGLELCVSFDEVWWKEGIQEEFVEIENLAIPAEAKAVEEKIKNIARTVLGFSVDEPSAKSYLKQYISRYGESEEKFS